MKAFNFDTVREKHESGLPTQGLNMVPTNDMDADDLEGVGISYETASAPIGSFVVWGYLPNHRYYNVTRDPKWTSRKSCKNWKEVRQHISQTYGDVPAKVDPGTGYAKTPGPVSAVVEAQRGCKWAYRVVTQASIDIATSGWAN